MTHKRVSLITILSLGLIILGIGCISYSVYNIWTQSGAPISARSENLPSKQTALETPEKSANDEIKKTANPTDTIKRTRKYTYRPKSGDIIGTLEIPSLNLQIPVIQGTSSSDLRRGAGHYIKSALPGDNDNCVMSAHRETYFRRLREVKIGNRLIVKTRTGSFEYKVRNIRIVDDKDRTVIVSKDHGVLTLTTCYPFDTPGYFPKRYIVSADLI